MGVTEQAINYDLAVDIINLMKTYTSNQHDKATSREERDELDKKIEMYCYEESVLNGQRGDDGIRQSLYDKVFNMYSPMIKELYGNR